MKRWLTFFLLLGLWCNSLWASVGYREWDFEGTRLSVWYPTDAAETQRKIGPFELNYAFDAEPSPGQRPLIVFSHGNGGHVHNHYLTLQALAQRGFVVVAPQHSASGIAKSLKLTEVIQQRTRDLDRAVRGVQANPQLRKVIDSRWVHGLGYGLGGTTVLVGAGATLDQSKIDAHCKAHASEDMDLCSNDPVSDFKHKISNLFSVFSRPNSITAQMHFAPIHGRVAVVAPMGQGLVIKPDTIMVSSLLTIAIEGDVIRPPRFHALALRQTIPQLTQWMSIPGHHYAFLAPLPKWMMKKNEYFTTHDPQGFDRLNFLDQVNGQLAEFFSRL